MMEKSTKTFQVCFRPSRDTMRARPRQLTPLRPLELSAGVFRGDSSRQVATAVGLFISRVCDRQGYSATECVPERFSVGGENGLLTLILALVEDNATKQATITRRPSRILVNAPPALPSASTSGLTGGGAGPPPHANAAAAGHPAGSALAIPINLVIRAPIVDSAPRIELQVSSDMYIVDVIELVLQRLSLASSETAHDFVLVVRLADGDMVVPPDRTVESLGEQHVLELVPRSDVGPAGLRRFRTRDEQPDAAGTGMRQIFASPPGTPHVWYVLTQQVWVATVTRPEHARETSQIPIADLAGLYERFTVLRKVPLSLGGRHARVIAIDGD